MDESRAIARLIEIIRGLPVTSERPPGDVDPIWSDLARGSLVSWASELGRDVLRIGAALSRAEMTTEREHPDDDQVAALEEALWRLHSATEKVDSIIAIAFTVDGVIRLYDSRARSLRFDPSYEANSVPLRGIGSDTALRLREARARLEGERAILRRHQVVHSLAPLVNLHDLAPFILVHHRDGRIIPGGYEFSRIGPERWNEGISSLTPEVLFARRLEEAARGQEALSELVGALAASLEADARIELPPLVYLDEGTRELALERPEPAGPVPHFDIGLVLGDEPAPRSISCTSRMRPGIELNLGDGRWRIVRVEEPTSGPFDQLAYCIPVERGTLDQHEGLGESLHEEPAD